MPFHAKHGKFWSTDFPRTNAACESLASHTRRERIDARPRGGKPVVGPRRVHPDTGTVGALTVGGCSHGGSLSSGAKPSIRNFEGVGHNLTNTLRFLARPPFLELPPPVLVDVNQALGFSVQCTLLPRFCWVEAAPGEPFGGAAPNSTDFPSRGRAG